MPLFIVGFVLTAGSRWVQAPTVDGRRLHPGLWICALGWVALPWAAGRDARSVAACLLAAGLGLALLCRPVIGMLRCPTASDRTHLCLIAAALLAMVFALIAAALQMVWGPESSMFRWSRVGLWWGPMVVFITASHRMLPFLGEGLCPALDRRWPLWTLWALLTLPAVRGAWALGATAPTPLFESVLSVHLAFGGALGGALALRLWGHPALRAPLLRMMFVASLWWPLGMGLLALGSWPMCSPEFRARLDLAGLHALTLGYLGGLLLPMVTRVTMTQAGHARVIGPVVTLLGVGLNLTAIVRIVAALHPEVATMALPAAAATWFVMALTWAVRYGPLLLLPPLRPRTGAHTP